MASPLLVTKLSAPRLRPDVVHRSRLFELMTRGEQSKLTLISAPAGSGKSTLLSDWIANGGSRQGSHAWLSLEPADNEPSRFWEYLIASVQTVIPSIGTEVLGLMAASPNSAEAALTGLINELADVPDDTWLVLDDYHVIDSPEIQAGMAFLLEHLPPAVHLVVSTRADPALPFGLLRARGELVEIRAADLRFTEEEASAFLETAMGLELSADQVSTLEQRTEGWIVALQLAALSVRGRDDVDRFIDGFAGSERYIVDYLVEEVLHRQSDSVRSFLVDTSILDRLTGPLCDAVTGKTDGGEMLEQLERSNLLVVPLDARRRWYRYHHLFADVLRARLLDGEPEHVSNLHRRASRWFEQEGDRSEAIGHAIAGKDFERAADLVELAVPDLRRARQESTMRRWFEALPLELFPDRPVLSIGYVGALMASGEFDRVDSLLAGAERWLEHKESETKPDMIVANHAELRRLPSAAAMYRAAQALMAGDDASARSHAQRAFDLAGRDDHLERGGAAGLLALTYWSEGRLDEAFDFWAEARARLEAAGHVSDAIGCTISLADIRIAQGRLDEAADLYERGLTLAAAGQPHRGAADMHVGMCEISCERGNLATAKKHLLAAEELGAEMGLPQNRYRARVAAARVHRVQGDLDGALDLLLEADRFYFGDFFPNVKPVPATIARYSLAAGRLSDALKWVRQAGLSLEDEPSYLREYEHVTLARILIGQALADSDEAIGRRVLEFISGLSNEAAHAARTGSFIEILLVQAHAHLVVGDRPAAMASLSEAIQLAEPAGFFQVLVDSGDRLVPLFEQLARHGENSPYLRRLLVALGREPEPTRSSGLVDPLTDRELQVLRLMVTDFTGPDMASELFVSLNTLRTHTKHIYTKLGVSSRRAAVRRATELGLLDRSATS